MKINKLNYFAEYTKISAGHRTENFVKTHEMLDKLTGEGKDWQKVNSTPSFSTLAEKQFAMLELIQKKHGYNTPESKVKKTERFSQSRKTRSVKPAKVKNHEAGDKEVITTIRKQTAKINPGSPVETVDPHLVMLTRYKRLNGKTVSKDRVLALARMLVKQIEARVLRKASSYSYLIDQMRTQLFDMIEQNEGLKVRVSIPVKTLALIEQVIGDQHQMRSVRLLRQYAGMAGRTTTIDRAKRLYNQMVTAIEKEQVPQDDRYFERVIEVMRHLKSYVEGNNERKQLLLLPAELSGVLGCGCAPDGSELNGMPYDDGEDNCISDPVPGRTVSKESLVPYVGKSGLTPINSLDFVKRKFHRYHIDEPWVRVFGHIEPGKHTVIFSKEKLGKTTALVDFAKYLSTNHGRVLFVQKEEELSGTFQDKFEQTAAANPDLDVLEEMPTDDVLRKYRFVFLDSVTRLKISPDQLLELQARLAPDVTLFAVLHSTKDGQHRGANTYVQDASQIVEFPEFGAAKGKGRFKQCTGELVRFADPRE